jgi:hypothetical protein
MQANYAHEPGSMLCAIELLLLLRKPQRARSVRVLHLDPRLARPPSVGILPVLRDDAFKAQPSGVLKDGRSVALDVLVELYPGVADLLHEMLEPAPALLKALDPQVDSAQLQQIEGVEEGADVVGPAAQQLEVGDTVGVAADRLAVEDQGARPKGSYRGNRSDQS